MNDKIKFEGFPKIPRLQAQVIVTEKIDGTNCFVQITHDGDFLLGSKNRFLFADKGKKSDNEGFAKWAVANKQELVKLGVGKHFGEWCGKGLGEMKDGIRRDYGLEEKKFVLFDTHKWNDENKPNCCEVVPVLYSGFFCTEKIKQVMDNLKENGSQFVKGYMNPEGIVIYHTGSKQLYKKTFSYDETGKIIGEELYKKLNLNGEKNK
jgi:hypothetical protein